jgi:hypothetical protein
MERGGLILEGAHTNKKIGATFSHYGVSRIQDSCKEEEDRSLVGGRRE